MSSASEGLFGAPAPAAPLAERLRPRSIDEVLGQRHLLGPGRPLRLAFDSGKAHSMILWGPPGTGKTTLARLMAQAFDAEFIALSAVFSGVKDIRDAVQRAEDVLAMRKRPTILFVDEVHRFNKAQQDAFQPYVEKGLFTFIGATTENPSFEVNSALLSRATVYVLESLSAEDLALLLERTGLDMLFEKLVQRAAVERPPSRCALVEDDTERVEVAPRVDGPAEGLFRGHVVRRAQKRSGARAFLNARHVRPQFGDSEVQDLRTTGTRDEDVVGFEIAMHDALFVRGP
jgi:adenylate kinase family enzyme